MVVQRLMIKCGSRERAHGTARPQARSAAAAAPAKDVFHGTAIGAWTPPLSSAGYPARPGPQRPSLRRPIGRAGGPDRRSDPAWRRLGRRLAGRRPGCCKQPAVSLTIVRHWRRPAAGFDRHPRRREKPPSRRSRSARGAAFPPAIAVLVPASLPLPCCSPGAPRATCCCSGCSGWRPHLVEGDPFVILPVRLRRGRLNATADPRVHSRAEPRREGPFPPLIR